MVQIVPAILTNDPREVREKLELLEGKVERVQIDILDGVFADNNTIFPDILERIETDTLIDFHLMTKEPVDWVERCVRGMADRIFGHVEMMTSQVEFIGKVQEVGIRVGLAFDLPTPVEKFEASLIGDMDAILLMSVPAGFGGQEFDKAVLAKIRTLSKIRIRNGHKFLIFVDGGINEENIVEVVQAGADEVAVGRRLFEGDMGENVKRLQEATYERNV